MRIKLTLFAFFRQVFGAPVVPYDLAEGSTVDDLLEDIFRKHPTLEKSRGHVVVTINKIAVKFTEKLKDGDDVAILPPVGGG